jgi:protein-L-isoaspartate(D-aspartate) O-methyltransferase
MVRRQLAARGIDDERVLEAFAKVPRERFVPDNLASRAYEDTPLPIGEGQTISQPYMVAVMTARLELTGSERVLEIGTGSGYQTALLAELAREVYTIERVEPLAARARAALDSLGYTNVSFRVGDGTLGWPEEAPFERVMVTAGAPDVPRTLTAQLAEGGVMAVPVGVEFQELVIVRRRAGKIVEIPDIGCRFVRLIGREAWPED